MQKTQRAPGPQSETPPAPASANGVMTEDPQTQNLAEDGEAASPRPASNVDKAHLPRRVRSGEDRAKWISAVKAARPLGLMPADLWVAADINDAADNQTCVATRKTTTIAKKIMFSPREVERSRDRLRGLGLLSWSRPHPKAANRYIMHLPAWALQANPEAQPVTARVSDPTPESAQRAHAGSDPTPESRADPTPESELYPTVYSLQPSGEEDEAAVAKDASASPAVFSEDDLGWPLTEAEALARLVADVPALAQHPAPDHRDAESDVGAWREVEHCTYDDALTGIRQTLRKPPKKIGSMAYFRDEVLKARDARLDPPAKTDPQPPKRGRYKSAQEQAAERDARLKAHFAAMEVVDYDQLEAEAAAFQPGERVRRRGSSDWVGVVLQQDPMFLHDVRVRWDHCSEPQRVSLRELDIVGAAGSDPQPSVAAVPRATSASPFGRDRPDLTDTPDLQPRSAING